MKILHSFFSLFWNASDKRLDLMIFSSGIMGSVMEWLTTNQSVIQYWLMIILIPGGVRIFKAYQEYLDRKQNRRQKEEKHELEMEILRQSK